MRKIADGALLLLQWGLVVLGLLVVIASFVLYRQQVAYQASLPMYAYEDTFFYAPSPLFFLLFGLVWGLIPIGLGGVLFYLRRLYLSRA